MSKPKVIVAKYRTVSGGARRRPVYGVTIPPEIAGEAGIKPGDWVVVTVSPRKDAVVIAPLRADELKSLLPDFL